MPDQDPYADAAPAAAPEPKPDPESDKAEEGESQTAEIPKSVLGGKKFDVGEEIVLKIDKIMEDSVLVSYASAPEEGKEKEAEPEPAPAPGGGNPMSSMMQ